MQGALAGKPVEDFQNVVPLEKVALTKTVKVDTPDSAPTEGGETPAMPDAAPENAAPARTPGKAPAAKSRRRAAQIPRRSPISRQCVTRSSILAVLHWARRRLNLLIGRFAEWIPASGRKRFACPACNRSA